MYAIIRDFKRHYHKVKKIYDELVQKGEFKLEISSANNLARQAVSAIHDEETFIAVLAEREFLRILEGGCQVPIGAYAEVKANGLYLNGFVGSLNGDEASRKN